MDVKDFLEVLSRIAPLDLAENWDNVGVLVEPSKPRPLKKIFLTNDLTEPVMAEAVDWQADCIISYHPPIFVPLKRLTQKDTKQRIIVQAIENSILIYSPHTAADSAAGGVNQWLLEGLKGNCAICPVTCKQAPPRCNLVIKCHREFVCDVKDLLQKHSARIFDSYKQADLESTHSDNSIMDEFVRFEAAVEQGNLVALTTELRKVCCAIAAQPLEPEQLDVGCGRITFLEPPLPLSKVIQRIKLHLGLQHVRVAQPEPSKDPAIRSVAVCAGSGGGADWFKRCNADALWTGEMSHHDVLACVAAGKTVILCDHSNTERGWLKVLAEKLKAECPDIDTRCSTVDADPLQVM